METFRDSNRDFNRIDARGNHFVNGKCVNPSLRSGKPIGSTYPSEETRDYKVVY